MEKQKTRRTPKPEPLTIKQQTEEWNRLAPEAAKLGLKVKVHTSPFENRATGERRLAWLTAEMKKAKRPRARKRS